ncbi:MAG: T9SS type A sorting domain-containing protein [Candidatus Krumholzibacteriota bacterium]|nr:T9SS type A sorting domain-containing protein [Candidatus Krumholzibacteriota bacterium]
MSKHGKKLLFSAVAVLVLAGRLSGAWITDGVEVCTAEFHQFEPKITTDGNGGAIVIWADVRVTGSYDGIYAQRVDENGNLLWNREGIAITVTAQDGSSHRMVSDNAGGAITAWLQSSDIYAQRIDEDGNLLWETGGVVVCENPDLQYKLVMVEDGYGGSIITWCDNRDGGYAIYAQRIDSAGNTLWTAGGVNAGPYIVGTYDESNATTVLTGDGAGGAIMVWYRETDGLIRDIVAQRIDAAGNPVWQGGILLNPDSVVQRRLAIVTDGSGGAIVSWVNYEDGEYAIYAQRLDPGGNELWTSGGVEIFGATSYDFPLAVEDGSGGAIVMASSRHYLQRVDRNGDLLWIPGSVQIYSDKSLDIAPDDAGGAIVSWRRSVSPSGFIILAQRVDAGGNKHWPEGGLHIADLDEDFGAQGMIPDGSGGAYIVYGDYRSPEYQWEKVFVQRAGFGSSLVFPSLVFPVTTAGDTSSAELVFNNHLGSPLVLREAPCLADEFFYQPEFGDSLHSGLTVPPDSFISGTVFFNPLSGGDHFRNIYFEDASNGDTLALVTFSGTGRPISFEWTNETDYSNRILQAGDTLALSFAMADHVEVDSLVLYYTSGGMQTLESARMNLDLDDPYNDLYSVKIQTSVGGARGLEFQVGAYNGVVESLYPSADDREYFRCIVDNLAFPEPIPARTYSMISIPLDVPENTLLGMLGDDLGSVDPVKWRMFTYEPGSSGYIEIPNDTISAIVQGQAYWVVASESLLLDTEPHAGASTPTDAPFSFTLKPGWNMIGNPFIFTVSWDSILLGDSYSSNQFDVEDPVWWNPSSGAYELGITYLEPFEGYWVMNNGPAVEMSIPASDASDLSAWRDPAMAMNRCIPETGWGISLMAITCGAEDMSNYLGVNASAHAGWDRYDCSEPPQAPGRCISLYFVRPGRECGIKRYAVDILPPPGAGSEELVSNRENEDFAGYAWHFDIAKNFSCDAGGDKIIIEFDGIKSIPSEFEVILVDRYSGSSINLRTKDSYHFDIGQRRFIEEVSEARFMILVGSDDFIKEHDTTGTPEVPCLFQNYPNPFNPATTIMYYIPENCTVRLEIFDVAGRRIAELINVYKDKGQYSKEWNGKDQNGNPVSSGIYFYRLKAGKETISKKMVLLR